jgi:hypothetical protein
MHPVRRLLPAALLALCAAGRAAAQEAPVVLDGVFDEWAGVAPAVEDAADAPTPYADVRSVKVRHDADAVYLALELDREFALHGMRGTLTLVLDEDADPATGWRRHGMAGVDAEIEFSAALGPDGTRMGTGLRLMHAEGTASCLGRANVAGVMAAPTHAARWHEVRIPRGEVVGFGGRMAARVVSLDSAGRPVDTTPVFTVDLADARPRPTPRGAGPADPLARAPGTDIRVVSWNVGREDLFEQPEAFGVLLRPLAPDLLILDEVAGGRSREEVEAVLNRILPGDLPWRAVYGVSGGSQRGVIAVRGAAPRLLAPFDRPIPYPDSTRALVPADDAKAAAWLRSRLDAHVPATGALVEIGGRRLFAVTVDLESGGTPGSEKDRLRRVEALAIRDAAEAAFIAGTPDGVDGILLAGDVNLVGTRAPLDILSAPAGDGPPLEVAMPLRLDGTSTATWENPEEPFTPGRLDFVLHHPGMTALTGGFVFRAEDLSPAWRERHGLQAESSRVTDHLPVVTDLRWVDGGR